MKKTDIKELLRDYNSLEGKSVRLAGWVKSVRDNKSIQFFILTYSSIGVKMW